MEKIDISEAFRKASQCDGVHGVDHELVTEGLGSEVARMGSHVVGGLWRKNIADPFMKKVSGVSNWFKEATGDIGHAISVDLKHIAKNGDNAEKWTKYVTGDLAKHVNHGLTGKGGMPADFSLPHLELPNGKTARGIPLMWGLCAQSSLFDIVNGKNGKLVSLESLLGTAEGVINIAAYMAGARPYGNPPYDDICSYIATGGGKFVKMATSYDAEKDNVFKESMIALFKSNWRPSFDKMAGTLNVMCSQLYVQSFSYLAENGICTFTERWYNANRHLWGWVKSGNEDKEPTDDACKDFEAQVSKFIQKGHTANNDTGPMPDSKVAVVAVDAIGQLTAGKIGESVVTEDGGFDDHGDPIDDLDDDSEVKQTQDDNIEGSDPETDDTDYGNDERSGEDQDDGKPDEKNAVTVSPSAVVASIESKINNFQSQKTKGNFENVKTAAKDAIKDESSFEKFKASVKAFLSGVGATSPTMDEKLKNALGSNADEEQKKINAVNEFIDKCKLTDETVKMEKGGADKNTSKPDLHVRKTGFKETKPAVPQKYQLNQNGGQQSK